MGHEAETEAEKVRMPVPVRIHILYDFKDGPWGGGNQFLKALAYLFIRKRWYEVDIADADVVLFNSHQCMKEVLEAKMRYPDKFFIHRIGPVFALARGDKMLDRLIHDVNLKVADGTVFQSIWSQEAHHMLGMQKAPFETNILNAPDPKIFHPINGRETSDKMRLITSGWSEGRTKGFDIYGFLDKHLDFSRYEYKFFGRSPIYFKHILHFSPKPSRQVAAILRMSDIFITASQNDACSNSLIEALHCGLPAVARDSGGHPEILGRAGVLFDGEDDVLDAIDKVGSDLETYRKQICLPALDDVGNQYYEFCEKVCSSAVPKKLKKKDQLKLKLIMKLQRTGEVIRGAIR